MSKYIMILLVAFCGCMVTNPVDEPEILPQNQIAHDQCSEIMGTFCTQANVCDPSAEQVAQCSEMRARACGLNRTEMAPLALQLCKLNQTQTTCDGSKVKMNPQAQACVSIFTAWREQDLL